MNKQQLRERRQHIRVYFQGLQEVTCRVLFPQRERSECLASVLDLSLGGLHLTLDREHSELQIGEQLIIRRLFHRSGMICETSLPVQVRWAVVRPEFSRIYFGCQFVGLSADCQSKIANLVSVILLEKSQPLQRGLTDQQ